MAPTPSSPARVFRRSRSSLSQEPLALAYSANYDFVHDLTIGIAQIYAESLIPAGDPELISVSTTGGLANGVSLSPRISADARFVVFESLADNLVEGDDNQTWEVFLRDRQEGATHLLSASALGSLGDKLSLFPAIAADGSAAVFVSFASNLVPGDNNAYADVFRSDLACLPPTSSSSRCSPADVTVDGTCVPGEGDNAVTLSDFSCYLSLWAADDPLADVTVTGTCTPDEPLDGMVDLSDFSCYLSVWSAGCP